MSCPRKLEVQACLDGEMDAVSSAAVERHIEGCAECTALRGEIEAIRRLMREEAPYHRASGAFRARLGKALEREAGVRARPNAFWRGAASGGVAVALAASLALLLLRPTAQDEIAGDVVSAHLRSLMGTHLIDVASSDHHTVKPWFDGHADVAPPVADFAGQGFKLVGGRVDYVHGERAAVVVYRHGAHVVNLFVWKNDGAASPGSREKNGYHLVAWAKGDLFFCAVSDTDADELKALQRLVQVADYSPGRS
jgi:anti-sigma factor RsiW